MKALYLCNINRPFGQLDTLLTYNYLLYITIRIIAINIKKMQS